MYIHAFTDARVSLEPGFTNISESVGIHEFCVVLTEEPDGGRAVPITVFISPMSIQDSDFKQGMKLFEDFVLSFQHYLATFSKDWNLTTDFIIFEMESCRECFNVTIFEDEIFEPIESFYISILSTSPPINVDEVTPGVAIEDSTAGIN